VCCRVLSVLQCVAVCCSAFTCENVLNDKHLEIFFAIAKSFG